MRYRPWVVVLVLSAGVVSAADAWYQAYDKGLRAIAARQWDEAEKQLKAAAAAGPRPGRQVRTYGMHFVDFLPGYHLGVVYLAQQRHREALEELQKVESSGTVARGDPEYARLREMIDQASARLARAASTPTAPAASTPTPAAAPVTAPPAAADAEAQHTRAAQEPSRKQDGGAKPEAGTTDVPRPTPAEDLVQEALRLAAAGGGPQARAALARARAAGVADPRLDALAKSLEVDQGVADLARLVETRNFDAARRKAAALARKDPRHPELLRLQAVLDRQAAGPVEVERAGIRAFYGGRYESAIELLRPLGAAPSPSARALLYVACSQAALGIMKGPEGAPLLARAREEFARLRSSPPALSEDERRFISPRIRRMFE